MPEPEVDLTAVITESTTESIAATDPLTATSILAAALSALMAAVSRLAKTPGLTFPPADKVPSRAPAVSITPEAVAASARAAPKASNGAVIAELKEFAEV